MPGRSESDLRWCVLVDGSSVSGKAFDSLSYFINGQVCLPWLQFHSCIQRFLEL